MLAGSILQRGQELTRATYELRQATEAWLEERGLPSLVIRHGLLTGSKLRIGPTVILPALPMLLLSLFIALKIVSLFVSLLSTLFMSGRRTVFTMIPWTLATLYRQLRGLTAFLIRSLPLLLLFVTFLFLQNEIWQVMYQLDSASYRIILFTVIMSTLLFAVIHLYHDVDSFSQFSSWEEVRSRIATIQKHPNLRKSSLDVKHLLALAPDTGSEGLPLNPSRREKINAVLVMLFVLSLQIFFVSMTIGCLFVALGELAISSSIESNWAQPAASSFAPPETNKPPEIDRTEVELFGWSLVASTTLVRVAGFISVFSAMYFTFYAIADDKLRGKLCRELDDPIAEAFAVRCIYASVGWPPKKKVNRDGQTYTITFELPAEGFETAKLLTIENGLEKEHPMERHRNGRFTYTLSDLQGLQKYYYRYCLGTNCFKVDAGGYCAKVRESEYSVIELWETVQIPTDQRSMISIHS
jgi:hypothetical protein